MISKEHNQDQKTVTSPTPQTQATIIDTHTHLYDPVFEQDIDAVLDRAQKEGVGAVISVSENLSDAQKNLQLAARFPQIKPAAGLYPTILDIEQAAVIRELIRQNRSTFVAIGEVGLDYWKVKEEKDRVIQKDIFNRFIQLSLEQDLPLNVHSRSAGRHAIALLVAEKAHKVQLHAFDGKASTARPGVDAGYFFSIPTSIVRSRQKQKLVRYLPLDCLLVETDSPVLGPIAQDRNEPANIISALDALCDLKKVKKSQLIDIIYQNTCRLYGKLA